MVSADAFECGGSGVCDLFPRFASSTPRDWPTLALYSKMNSARGAHRLHNCCLILAKGATPCIIPGTDYALPTLSAMFPKSLAHKVSLLFTNVLSSPHGDFSLETITRELQGSSTTPSRSRGRYLEPKDAPCDGPSEGQRAGHVGNACGKP